MARISYYHKQHHLQITCTPAEYPYLLEQWWTRRIDTEAYRKAYTQVAPRYLISRCPFCDATHTACVDTHSIVSWSESVLGWGRSFGQEETEQVGCQHFHRTQRFVNLEGTVPVEQNRFASILHVPFVMPFYLPDNVTAIAVIHSLPICRIEDAEGHVFNFYLNTFCDPIAEIPFKLRVEVPRMPYVPVAHITPEDKERLTTAQFIHRYTAFAVTYYALHPASLHSAYIDSQLTKDMMHDPDFTAADLSSLATMQEIALKYPEGYHLKKWVEKGKLQWLDLDDPLLSLKSGPAEIFPYSNIFDITGKYEPFRYRFGFFSWNT